MTATEDAIELKGPADVEFGYPFAIDGLMTPDEACEWLKVSRDSLDTLWKEGGIRKGKFGRQFVRYCKRSVKQFARRSEV